MAELLIKVGSYDGGNPKKFQDGDILCAMTDRRIRHIHAEMLCDCKNELNSDNLRPIGSLGEALLSNIKQYKFQRISQTSVLRTNLHNPLETPEVFDQNPNKDGQYIDVPTYLARRLNHPAHKIFGTKGNEFWFGGNTKADTAALDIIWAFIEANSVYRESNFTLWPFTPLEKRNYLALSVDDFDETEADNLTRPEYDTDGSVKTKRQQKVDWQTLSEIPTPTKTDIPDTNIEIDIRKSVTGLLRSNIVETKVSK